MTFEWRLALVVLSAFAAASLPVSAWVAWRWRRRRLPAAAAARARALVGLRWRPAAAGLLAAALAAAAFARFEPREADESLGVGFLVLASAGAVLLGAGALRLALVLAATRRLTRAWLRDAAPVTLPGLTLPAFAVDSAYPIVAVAGWMRPRLIVARSVLDACPPAELAAVVGHEERHAARRDNLARLALAAVPDVLAWLPVSGRLQAAWSEAAEEAADEGAGASPRARATLAAALVRVARLAPADPAPALPTSALFRGEDLGPRVRRLLAPPDAAPVAGPRRAARTTLGLAATMALLGLESIHHAVELAVRVLP